MSGLVYTDAADWRLLFLRRDGSELFVLENDRGLFLPSVGLPVRNRLAPQLNAHVKAIWNLECVSLYPLDSNSSSTQSLGSRYHVAEALDRDANGSGPGRWLHVSALREAQFAENGDWAAIRQWQQSLEHDHFDGNSTHFGRPGSFLRIREWVQESLGHGRRLTGRFLQLNAGQSFGLIRFDTETDAVWFKAVGPPNEREFPLTSLLCGQFPLFTPELLATHLHWKAWLTSEVPGAPLSESPDSRNWINAARDLAAVQIGSVGALDRFRLGEPRDVQLSTLQSQIHPFFECVCGLMDNQAKRVPPKLSSRDLEQLKDGVGEGILRLKQAGLPDTVGHLDLNPENIIPLPNRTVFLDWAEMSIGHPFFSFAHLLEHWRGLIRNLSDCDNHLVPAYLNVWTKQWSAPDPNKILCLTVLLAVFAHAVSTDAWRDGTALQDPVLAGYYRSLARRMKFYSDRLSNGASQLSEMFG